MGMSGFHPLSFGTIVPLNSARLPAKTAPGSIKVTILPSGMDQSGRAPTTKRVKPTYTDPEDDMKHLCRWDPRPRHFIQGLMGSSGIESRVDTVVGIVNSVETKVEA